MKLIGIITFSLVTILILIEIGLRLIGGLGKRPLYIKDSEIGYLLAPNQKVNRFGKTTIVNQYSMRTQPIEPQVSSGTLRVFMLGDSIINGNWWTDQDKILSVLVEKQLKPPHFNQVEVLNASANSWSPRNQLAYLKRFGTFESQVIVLVINTDDLYGRKPTDLVVGKELSYPDHQPIGAMGEIIERLLYRYRSQPLDIPKETGDILQRNLEAMAEIKAIAEQSNAIFILAMTPLLREVNHQSKPQEIKGRERLNDWIHNQGITFIDFISQFQAINAPISLYRDHIHLSPLAEEIVSGTLAEVINKKSEFLTQ